MEFIAGLAIGILVGLVAGFLAADAIVEKNKRTRGELTARERYELEQVRPREYPERPHAPMYQPPVIVLAAPRAQGSEQTALVK